MGKSKRKGHKKAAEPVYDSDDERAYSKEAVPDSNADDFYHDDVDAFHANRDKILLDTGADLPEAGDSADEQEEVLSVGDDDDDDDDFYEEKQEIAKYDDILRRLRAQGIRERRDSEDDEEEEGKEKDDQDMGAAWGKKRSQYYGGDVDDEDDVDFYAEDPDTAVLEEEEALAMQKKMAAELEDQDFGLDIFKSTKKKKDESEKETIQKDLSKLSKKEKLQLLKKESPELLELIEDYKAKMSEVQDVLLPIQRLIKDGTLPPSSAADYVETKLRLCLNYCINISFYMMLKAKHAPVHSHPVINRMVQYRNLIKQLEPADVKIKPELDAVLEKIAKGEEVRVSTKAKPKTQKPSLLDRVRKQKSGGEKEKKKLSQMLEDSEESSDEDEQAVMATGGRTWDRKRKPVALETSAEKEALEYYESMKATKRRKGQNSEEGVQDQVEDVHVPETLGQEQEVMGEEVVDGKRAINREILKNRGLTAHRKKIDRNPRVKNRMKFKKALIRRKSQVPNVRTEMARYGGEAMGIRAGIKRSVRLK